MIFDIIISGAGPSGGYLGYLLSKEGFKTLVLEKEKFPRLKSCGGGISPKTIKLLPFDLSPVTEQRISKGKLSYNNKESIIRDEYEMFGIVVERSKFDSYIIEQGIKNGLSFYDQHAVVNITEKNDLLIIHANGRQFLCKYFVFADGANGLHSHLVKNSNKRHLTSAVTATVSMSDDQMKEFNNTILFDFGIIEKGYAWAFPLKNSINVGIYSPYTRKDFKKALYSFFDAYPMLNKGKASFQAARIPLKRAENLSKGDKLFLIGDAAGLCESFFGEGIYYSLKSAEVAHKHIKALLENVPVKGSYSDEVMKAVANDLDYSRVLANVFYYDLRKSYNWLVRNDYVSKMFAKTMAGELSYKKLFFTLVLSSPFWLFSQKSKSH